MSRLLSTAIFLVIVALGVPREAHAQLFSLVSPRVATATSKDAAQTTPNALVMAVTAAVAQDHRIVVYTGFTDASGTVAATDTQGNSYSVVLDSSHPGQARHVVLTANADTALTTSDRITVTFPVAAVKAAGVAVFQGVPPRAPIVHQSATQFGTSSTISTGTINTTVANLLVVGSAAIAGPSTDNYVIPAGSNLLPVDLWGTTGGSDISTGAAYRIVTATGAYGAFADVTPQRSWASGVVGFLPGPSTLDLTGPASFTAGCSGAYTITTRNPSATAVAPTSTITLGLSSSSSATVRYFRDSTCSTNEITAANPLTMSTSTATFYVLETVARTASATLTASVTTSNTGIRSDSLSYTVNPGAATKYAIVLPGQGFTGGTGVTGTPTSQTVGTAFTILAIYAVDANNNIDTTYGLRPNVTWSGLSNSCTGTVPNFSSSRIQFASGVATTTVSVTPRRAETTSITMAATLSGTSSPLTVYAPTSSVTVGLGTPTSGYATRSNGRVSLTLSQTTGCAMTSFIVRAPTGWTISNQSAPSGWTASGSGSAVTYTSTTGLASGASAITFTVVNSGAVYPNLAAGAQVFTGDVTELPAGTRTVSFTLNVPVADVVLPVVMRDATSGTRPTLWFTSSGASQGILVVRGNDTPVDGVSTYAVGSTIGSSVVVCSVTASTSTCTEPGTISETTGTSTYGFYQWDSSRVYSAGVRISVPAKPSSGFLYKHAVTGLTPPGLKGLSGQQGFAVFGANDRGLYFVRADGQEVRRAVQTSNPVTRRSIPLTDGSSWALFTADSGSPNAGQLYRVTPTGSPATSTTNAPVTSGVGGIIKASSAALHSTYSANVYLIGTNASSGNFIRAFNPSLTTYWSFDIGTDAITNEISSDVTRAYSFVPVGAGGGGIYGFDMSQAPSGGVAPQIPGWGARKILSGTLFKAQCRMPFGWDAARTALFCGSSTGTIYAINPATGAVLASTSVTGSVQSVLPISNAPGMLFYSTRSGRIGRLAFDGTAFSSTFEATISGATAVSTPVYIASRGALYVGANGAIYKLDASTGATVTNRALDGLFISEIGFDAFSATLFAESDNGTIWGVPFF